MQVTLAVEEHGGVRRWRGGVGVCRAKEHSALGAEQRTFWKASVNEGHGGRWEEQAGSAADVENGFGKV